MSKGNGYVDDIQGGPDEDMFREMLRMMAQVVMEEKLARHFRAESVTSIPHGVMGITTGTNRRGSTHATFHLAVFSTRQTTPKLVQPPNAVWGCHPSCCAACGYSGQVELSRSSTATPMANMGNGQVSSSGRRTASFSVVTAASASCCSTARLISAISAAVYT